MHHKVIGENQRIRQVCPVELPSWLARTAYSPDSSTVSVTDMVTRAPTMSESNNPRMASGPANSHGPHDDVDVAWSTLGEYANRHEISVDGPRREYHHRF